MLPQCSKLGLTKYTNGKHTHAFTGNSNLTTMPRKGYVSSM